MLHFHTRFGNNMKIRFYADPGHGWGRVKITKLRELGLLDHISSYSYVRGEYAYLEEDCDLSIFCNAMRKLGKTVTFRAYHSNKSSRIRKYQPYTLHL